MNVLVAYASKYGSTKEVAESIAHTLRERCVRADVVPADEVESLDRYDGVVLGGGIYMGRWHRNARGFARHFADELERMPVAVFALGPIDDVPEHREGSEKQFRKLLGGLPFETFSTALFGGAVDPRKLSFPFSYMEPADVRDWDEIRAWGLAIAEVFLSAAVPS